MERCRKSSGFTLFELVVVVCLVSILAGVAFERLRYYQEAAEATAVESNLSVLKNALHIRSAELISANRWDELQRLPQQNPFELLEEKPANYGGGWLPDGRAGQWYYDDAAKQVVYRVGSADSFSASDGKHEMRFAVIGRDASGKVAAGGSVAYVSLRPLSSYRWLERAIR